MPDKKISTARALEVCLARVRMSKHTANELLAALAAERRKPETPVVWDCDYLVASLMQVHDFSTGVRDFPRKSLLIRHDLIREVAAEALK